MVDGGAAHRCIAGVALDGTRRGEEEAVNVDGNGGSSSAVLFGAICSAHVESLVIKL